MSRCCGWLGRDDEGRPFCVHGPAFKQGPYWRCRAKHAAANRRYNATEKGKAFLRKHNAAAAQQSSKALYELTRIRTGG